MSLLDAVEPAHDDALKAFAAELDAGRWWVYVPLDALRTYHYVEEAGLDPRSPPPQLVLKRPIGRPEAGDDRQYWATSTHFTDATLLRDRLGLATYAKSTQVFQVRVDVADPMRPLFIPTALDSGGFPAWRCPPAGHTRPWGMTRNLKDDDAAEPELLALPDGANPLAADHVGQVATPPPKDYLAQRLK
jgi:hypothetical protein